MLGVVDGEQVKLSVEGQIVQATWNTLPQHYSHIEVDEFIIMPNHVHGIVWIKDDILNKEHVGEGLRPSPTQHVKRHSLSEIMRAFKSFSSRRINEQSNTQSQPFWQRSFYDHVIRDEDSLLRYRKYIQENPLKWTLDEYHAQT